MWYGCSCSSACTGGAADLSVTLSISPLAVAIKDCCPFCGARTLYKGWVTLAETCSKCGLSFAEHDSGDGPAFFSITLLGFVVVGAALFVEFTYKPDYWVHLLLWPVLLLALTPISLRFFKSYLLGWQYKSQLLNQDDQ